MNIGRPTLKQGAVLTIGALLAFLSGRDAFVSANASVKPATALSVDAVNADALVSSFNRASMEEGFREEDVPQWSDRAQRALRETPLNAGAIRIFALGADAEKRRELMLLSERVSRRDVMTQLWLIEDAVGREDVEQALVHYDRTLSISYAAQGQMFKVLANALALDEVRAGLVPYVRANRPWAYNFVGYSVDNAASPALAADLLRRAGGSKAVPSYLPIETMMLDRLVRKGEGGEARRYAETMPGGGKKVFDDFAMLPETLEPTMRPFTWMLSPDVIITTHLGDDGVLQISVPPASRGLAARRSMALSEGRWRLQQTVEFPSLSPMAALTWKASCPGPQPAGLMDRSIPTQPGRKTFTMEFEVPADCAVVQFDLGARGDDAQVDAQATVRNLTLTRVN